MTRTLAAFSALTLTAGCVTTTAFRPGERVEVQDTGLGSAYKQGGVPIRPASLWDGLAAVEATREEARTGQTWAIGGAVLGGGGGLCLGYGIVAASDGRSSGWPLIAGGVALTAAGIWAGVVGDRHTLKAVETYNASLPPEPPKVSWAPYLAPVASARPGAAGGLEGGVVLRF